jgi:hypothetical protein
MCLCGILAGEPQTLPHPMREALMRFFDTNEIWLVALLERGRVDGSHLRGGVTVTRMTASIASMGPAPGRAERGQPSGHLPALPASGSAVM